MSVTESEPNQEPLANYIVHINDWYGRRIYKCDTASEA